MLFSGNTTQSKTRAPFTLLCALKPPAPLLLGRFVEGARTDVIVLSPGDVGQIEGEELHPKRVEKMRIYTRNE
jgi:hypothetical protein